MIGRITGINKSGFAFLIGELVSHAANPAHVDYLPDHPLPGSAQEQAELTEVLMLREYRDNPAGLVCAQDLGRRRPVSRLLPPMQTGRELALFFAPRVTSTLYRQLFNQYLAESVMSPQVRAHMQMCLNLALEGAAQLVRQYQWRCRHLDLLRTRARPRELDGTLVTLMNTTVSSYPMRCSVSAGAASMMAAHCFPQQREEWANLADNVGMARLWAGVNYRSEHVHGLRLGQALAARLPWPWPLTVIDERYQPLPRQAQPERVRG